MCFAVVRSSYTRRQNIVAYSWEVSLFTIPKNDWEYNVARGSRKRWTILNFGNNSARGTKVVKGMRIVLIIMCLEVRQLRFITGVHCLIAEISLVLVAVLLFMHATNSFDLCPLFKNRSEKKMRGRFSKLHLNISFRNIAAKSRKFVYDLEEKKKIIRSYLHQFYTKLLDKGRKEDL